ncbi:MAG TPA: aldolase [Planctomycetaceae bacterium]|nr:aldolase [Planctomycetaceae bacterium]
MSNMPESVRQPRPDVKCWLTLYMIVNDPEIAKYICEIEDVWPFVDLEYIGKMKRQSHVESWKSHHSMEDVSLIREAVPDAHLLVRVNPLNETSGREIDEVIARGADTIMLPMFHDIDTLARFYDLLDGRVEVLPLFETAGAIRMMPEAIERLPIEALHIGLNDLHLDLGLTWMFECISKGHLEEAAAALRAAGTRFGIGGIAQVGKGVLNAECVLREHVRLGSNATILSRSFHGFSKTKNELVENVDFSSEVEKLRFVFAESSQMSPEFLEENRNEMRQKTQEIVRSMTQSQKTKTS